MSIRDPCADKRVTPVWSLFSTPLAEYLVLEIGISLRLLSLVYIVVTGCQITTLKQNHYLVVQKFLLGSAGVVGVEFLNENFESRRIVVDDAVCCCSMLSDVVVVVIVVAVILAKRYDGQK